MAKSQFHFLSRRVRLKHSPISIPLGVLVFTPLTFICFLYSIFLYRHPNSPAAAFRLPGTPPAIRGINQSIDRPFVVGCLDPELSAKQTPRANGVLVMLARNTELWGAMESIESVERHFNRWFHYPYVFLNDGEFDDNFRETIGKLTTSKVEYGRVDRSMWGFPEWQDAEEAREWIAEQGDQAIMYGGLESYHHMCRFNSGFFYRHPLLEKYEWYWRIEPDIKYFCDITYDPFVYMERNNKVYGFVIAIKELVETVPNIFRYAAAYKRTHNFTSKGMWEMFLERPPQDEARPTATATSFMPQEILWAQPDAHRLPDIDPEAMEGETYNMCHFWSNFEIARLDFFRSKEYEEFFSMMDRTGGFWQERWGDAPIHSLAAGILLSPHQVHYFRDIGYRHTTIQHCPGNAPARQRPRSPYIETGSGKSRDVLEDEDTYWDSWDPEQVNGVGCRCKCDTDVVDVEGKEGNCLNEWADIVGGWTTPPP